MKIPFPTVSISILYRFLVALSAAKFGEVAEGSRELPQDCPKPRIAKKAISQGLSLRHLGVNHSNNKNTTSFGIFDLHGLRLEKLETRMT